MSSETYPKRASGFKWTRIKLTVYFLELTLVLSIFLIFYASRDTMPSSSPDAGRGDCKRGPVTPEADLLPWAICNIRKHASTNTFVYGYGSHNIRYPYLLTPPPYTKSDPQTLQIIYPKNSINPRSGRVGGIGFYTALLPPLTKTEAYIEYEIYFPVRFKWVKGGKLPGLWGGKIECSGGDQAADCFSVRLMWRSAGEGEAYLYIPRGNVQHPDILRVRPFTEEHPKFGLSLGRGAFRFEEGKWHRMGIYIRLNSIATDGIPKQDGIIKVLQDGDVKLDFDKVVWRTNSELTVGGVMFDTFFGGSRPGFEAAEDSWTGVRGLRIGNKIREPLKLAA